MSIPQTPAYLFDFKFYPMVLKEKIRANDQASSLANRVQKHQKLLIGFTFQDYENLFIQKRIGHGIPVFPSPGRAARAMAAFISYVRLIEIRSSSL